MSLLTFGSFSSRAKLANKIIVADTSYLIALSDVNDKSHQSVDAFHKTVLNNGAIFYINVNIRQEFIKKIRSIQLIEAIIKLAASDSALATRYRILAQLKPDAELNFANLKTRYDKIYKDHVKKGDIRTLVDALDLDIFKEVLEFENRSSMTYLSGAGKWEDLGFYINNYGFDANDCMIVNFAFSIGADAIVTTDCDYAQIADIIDIYMPLALAKECSIYEPLDDI